VLERTIHSHIGTFIESKYRLYPPSYHFNIIFISNISLLQERLLG